MKDFFEYVWTTKNNEFVVTDRKKAVETDALKQKKLKYLFLTLFVIGVVFLGLFVYFTSSSSFKEAFINYWYLFIFGIILSFGAYTPYVKLKNMQVPENDEKEKDDAFDSKVYKDILIYTSAKKDSIVPFTIKVYSNDEYIFINDFISIYRIDKANISAEKEDRTFIIDDKKLKNLYKIIIKGNDCDLFFYLDKDHVYNIINN